LQRRSFVCIASVGRSFSFFPAFLFGPCCRFPRDLCTTSLERFLSRLVISRRISSSQGVDRTPFLCCDDDEAMRLVYVPREWKHSVQGTSPPCTSCAVFPSVRKTHTTFVRHHSFVRSYTLTFPVYRFGESARFVVRAHEAYESLSSGCTPLRRFEGTKTFVRTRRSLIRSLQSLVVFLPRRQRRTRYYTHIREECRKDRSHSGLIYLSSVAFYAIHFIGRSMSMITYTRYHTNPVGSSLLLTGQFVDVCINQPPATRKSRM
jgi:hypothetical protein